jgi:hypothetical protein
MVLEDRVLEKPSQIASADGSSRCVPANRLFGHLFH